MDFEEDDFSLASGYGWTDKYLLVYGGSCVWRPKLCHLTDNTVSRFCLRLPPQYSPPSIENIYNTNVCSTLRGRSTVGGYWFVR